MNYLLQPLGDQALRIEWTDKDIAIRTICAKLSSSKIPGVVDIVPGISSITIFYEYPTTDYYILKEKVIGFLETMPVHEGDVSSRTVMLPVLYDGPDLADLAGKHQTSVEEIIEKHSGAAYEVAMLGFLPGFPYLNGLPSSLATPRLATPRSKVPAGSVGIGGEQTGIYPVESPGGWNLIGRTPIPLFSPDEKDSFLMQAGDKVRFQPVSEEEFNLWQEKVSQSDWKKEVIIYHEKND
ncbi:5-oxoprolinase subunit PxpB [Bacillus tianshenii]|uniref:5-oxoprolinase subunit PxpB n=1 Tax=Sutcliffiella tianshenii TaxID=1463404 RepID=UPI001CD2D7C4|nr:5-oxoprolinase subunit PxpB [Bacillus tianshenii]MCA1320349.1 5-oxoprolinase subunit PxpB [Bacillus tianshenii]